MDETESAALSKPSAPSINPGAVSAAASSFPIVGIGASAGGLDAFRRLLGRSPTTPAWPTCSCNTSTQPREHLAELHRRGHSDGGLRGQGGRAGGAQPGLRHPPSKGLIPLRDMLKFVPRGPAGAAHDHRFVPEKPG